MHAPRRLVTTMRTTPPEQFKEQHLLMDLLACAGFHVEVHGSPDPHFVVDGVPMTFAEAKDLRQGRHTLDDLRDFGTRTRHGTLFRRDTAR